MFYSLNTLNFTKMKTKQLFLIGVSVLFTVLTSATTVKNHETLDLVNEEWVCNATVSNLTATRNGQFVTFNWNTSGADGYSYGGYYNVCPPPPDSGYTVNHPSQTVWTTTTSHQITLYSPTSTPGCVGHFGVGAKCSNGETGGYQSVWYY